MKGKVRILLVLLGVALFSCSVEDDVPGPSSVETERTIFVYMPWSTNLLGAFRQNLEDLKTSILENRIRTDRFIVYLAQSQTQAELFEVKYNQGQIDTLPIKSYQNPAFTTAEGIAGFIDDVVSYAPAPAYSMIIGCHGMGWITVDSWWNTSAARTPLHWDHEGSLTRYFGGSYPECQTDVATLAQAIGQAGVKMEYILFDDCYMSSIEVAYELKEVTDHLIACPTEVMFYGFPYHVIGEHLTGKVDYEGIAEGFFQFYDHYTYPYGTIAVTVCSELDNLAAVMYEINERFTFDASLLGQVQRMDGYTPVIFFDYGDYVSHLCADEALLSRFEAQLERTVPSSYKRHTEEYYTDNLKSSIPIRAFSGVTVSDPSTHSVTSAKTETAWYKATHP
ncbi:MAG: clostripain-related cysteine peptidase [Rikenellaceae bacterium]|nr:clostripain-related cysteine peptidase [Rikenellaceae bacterium]